MLPIMLSQPSAIHSRAPKWADTRFRRGPMMMSEISPYVS
jgi:hypothetical protein